MRFQLFQPSSGEDQKNLRLTEILAPLSKALDLTEGQPPGHCVRVCWIGTRLGQHVGLRDDELSDLYYALLLKDLGCSSNSARIRELYQTDDITFRSQLKGAGCGMRAALVHTATNTLDIGVLDRLKALGKVVKNGRVAPMQLMRARCERGAEIAARLRFSTRVQDGIRHLDDRWNTPDHGIDEGVPLISRIALIAQIVDVFHARGGSAAARSEITKRAGSWLDPSLCSAFLRLSDEPGFWETLHAQDIEAAVFDLSPAHTEQAVDPSYLDDIVGAFADVIDAKGSFTADHSKRVAAYADFIAEAMGLTPEHRAWMRRGALLHDLGKLGVSNSILDKEGSLTPEEWERVRAHSAMGADIIQNISGLCEVAPLARWHHERLDGTGYPDGLTDLQLPLEVCILTVADVFDALIASRPYRSALSVHNAIRVLKDGIGKAFDKDCVAAIESTFMLFEQGTGYDLSATA